MEKIKILNQRVDIISPSKILNFIEIASRQKKKTLIFASNIHNLVTACNNDLLLKFYDRADIIFADGQPIVWYASLLTKQFVPRVSGTELAQNLLDDKKKSIFVVTSSDLVARYLSENYSSVRGTYTPPFGKDWTDQIDAEIIHMINQAKTKIVLMGISSPKQEIWLHANLMKTNASVGIALGSAFEIISGSKKRAPIFVQRSGFEWLYRVLQEPMRLGPRYLTDLFLLFKLLFIKKKDVEC